MESVIVNLKNTLVDEMCGKTQCVMCTDEGYVWINLREALGV